ncbi:MAG: hypothetical protein WDN50_07985 [Bradyrhizobium sp.]
MYYVDLAVTGVSFGCMYAMMAVGLTLVYGLLRILHVAHAAVFALGAYITVLASNASGSIALGFYGCHRRYPLCLGWLSTGCCTNRCSNTVPMFQ